MCLCNCNRGGTRTNPPESLGISRIPQNVQRDFEEPAVIGDDAEQYFAIQISHAKLPFCLRQFDNSTFLKVEDDAVYTICSLLFPSYKYISVKFQIQDEKTETQISQNQRVS